MNARDAYEQKIEQLRNLIDKYMAEENDEYWAQTHGHTGATNTADHYIWCGDLSAKWDNMVKKSMKCKLEHREKHRESVT